MIGEASSGRDALQMVYQLSPDMVIMDIAMPDIERRRGDSPNPRKLPGLQSPRSQHAQGRRLRPRVPSCRSKGYLLKDAIDQDLLPAVRAVAGGDGFLSPEISGRSSMTTSRPKTRSIVSLPESGKFWQLLADGKVAKEIATRST